MIKKTKSEKSLSSERQAITLKRTRSAILTDIIPNAGDIKGFIFRLDRALDYIPGQYVMMSFPGEANRRSFSIVDYDADKRELLLIIKKNGEFTQRLFKSDVGTEIDMLGPYGRFTIQESDKSKGRKIVMIGGGIGITPLYNMAINHMDKDITIYYSVKNEALAILSKDLSSHDVRHTYTMKGDRLTPEDVYTKDAIYYICGPPGMIETFRSGLTALGVDNEDIRTEDFTC